MSGDMNTALGNCLIVIAMYNAAMEGLRLDGERLKFELFDDGDDCLFFCEKEHLELIKVWLPWKMGTFGMKLKTESVAYSIREIEFCQLRPLWTGEKWILCRDPKKSTTVMKVALQNAHWRSYSWVVGAGMVAKSVGQPINQAYGKFLMRTGQSPRKPIPVTHPSFHTLLREGYVDKNGKLLKDFEGEPVTEIARTEFWRTFGISVEEQLRIENILATVTWDGASREILDRYGIQLYGYGVGTTIPSGAHPALRHRV